MLQETDSNTETKEEVKAITSLRDFVRLLRSKGIGCNVTGTPKHGNHHFMRIDDPNKIEEVLAIANENNFAIEHREGTTIRTENPNIVPKSPKGQVTAATVLEKNKPKVKTVVREKAKSLQALKDLLAAQNISVNSVHRIKGRRQYALYFLKQEHFAQALEIAKAANYKTEVTGKLAFRIPSDGTYKKPSSRKRKGKSKAKTQTAVAASQESLKVSKPAKTKTQKIANNGAHDIAHDVAVVLMKSMTPEQKIVFAQLVCEHAGGALITDADKEFLERARKVQQMLG